MKIIKINNCNHCPFREIIDDNIYYNNSISRFLLAVKDECGDWSYSYKGNFPLRCELEDYKGG